MSLRELAAADAALILGDVGGFSVALTLVSPAGVDHAVRGQLTDISRHVDLASGETVSGRRVAASIAASAAPAGLSGVDDSAARPWVLRHGADQWRVVSVDPDRVIGIVELALESWAT